MEEKIVEGYTPEEVEAIRKKDRFYNRARRAVGVSIVSFFGAALISFTGFLPLAITGGALTDKQTALVDDLCSSSEEYHEIYTEQLNGLRSDLVSNEITDKQYMESVEKLNSKEHKREVLFTLSDVDLTVFNNKEQTLEKVIKARDVFTSICLGNLGMIIPISVLGDRIRENHFNYREEHKYVLYEAEKEY